MSKLFRYDLYDLNIFFKHILISIDSMYLSDVTLLTFILITIIFLLKNKKTIEDRSDVKFLLKCFLCSHIVFLWAFFSFNLFFRYFIPYYFLLILIISIISKATFNNIKNILPIKQYIYLILILALSTCLTSDYIKKIFIPTYKENYFIFHIEKMRKISKYIYNSTSWDYKTFINRTFHVGISTEFDLATVYKQTVGHVKPSKIHTSNDFGIFITQAKTEKEFSNNLPIEIRQAYKNDQIIIQKLKTIRGISIVKYIVKPDSDIPTFFQNIGFHYIVPKHVKNLSSYYLDKPLQNTIKLGNNKWRGCWDCKSPYWKNIDLEILNKNDSQKELEIFIDGHSLSCNDSVAPLRTETLINVYAKIICSNKIINKPLGSIGINKFKAPYKNSFTIKCKNIKSVSIGYQQKKIYNLVDNFINDKADILEDYPITFKINTL